MMVWQQWHISVLELSMVLTHTLVVGTQLLRQHSSLCSCQGELALRCHTALW